MPDFVWRLIGYRPTVSRALGSLLADPRTRRRVFRAYLYLGRPARA